MREQARKGSPGVRKRPKMEVMGGCIWKQGLFRGICGDGMKGLYRKSSGRRESSVSEWEERIGY